MRKITIDELEARDRPFLAISCGRTSILQLKSLLRDGPGSLFWVFGYDDLSSEAWYDASKVLQKADYIVLWTHDGRYLRPCDAIFTGMAVNFARNTPIYVCADEGAPRFFAPIKAFWRDNAHLYVDSGQFLDDLHKKFVEEPKNNRWVLNETYLRR